MIITANQARTETDKLYSKEKRFEKLFTIINENAKLGESLVRINTTDWYETCQDNMCNMKLTQDDVAYIKDLGYIFERDVWYDGSDCEFDGDSDDESDGELIGIFKVIW